MSKYKCPECGTIWDSDETGTTVGFIECDCCGEWIGEDHIVKDEESNK